MLTLKQMNNMMDSDRVYLYEALKVPYAKELDVECALSGRCKDCPSMQKWDKQFEEGKYASMLYVDVYIKRTGEDRCAITIKYWGREFTKEFPVPNCLEAFRTILELGMQAGREVSMELDDFGTEEKWGPDGPPVDWNWKTHFGWGDEPMDFRFVEI